jgi:hypothetical protein
MWELTEEQKIQIQAEEAFRQEVRRKLEQNPPLSKSEKTWKCLNQSFVLWTLSTVVVGLIGFAYARVHTGLVLQAENARAIERLNHQAGIRLEYAMLLLSGH